MNLSAIVLSFRSLLTNTHAKMVQEGKTEYVRNVIFIVYLRDTLKKGIKNIISKLFNNSFFYRIQHDNV